MVRIKYSQRKSLLNMHNKHVKNKRLSNNKNRKKDESCIIIDTDSDNDDVIIVNDNAQLFYEDLKPGFSNKEIPLYSTNLNDSFQKINITNNNNENENHNNKVDLDDSVIILNDTIESDKLVKPKPQRKCQNKSFLAFSQKLIKNKRKNRQAATTSTITKTIVNNVNTNRNLNENNKKNGLKKRFIIIDGSNVAFSYSKNCVFSVKGLSICIDYFSNLGFELKAIVPQYRTKPSQTTDHKLLEQLYKDGKVLFTPGKKLNGKYVNSYDDRFILDIAINLNGAVISNDNYNDLINENLGYKQIIESRVVGYTWCNDYLILPKDPYGQFGPTLDEILYIKES